MMQSFGARLRHRREEQSIALVTIADETKIKRSLLEALERDDVSQWPSGIFRRAFIRAYAHAIGLNPDDVVREFLEIYPDPVEDVAPLTAVEAAADGMAARGNAPTRFSEFVGSAFGSLSRRRAPLQASPESDPIPHVEAVTADAARVPQPVPSAGEVDRRLDVLADVRTDVHIDMQVVAELCTQLAQVETQRDLQPLLERAASIVDALGLIVWVWDAGAGELRPALAHGYSDKVLAQLPAVRRDADNATAAAFRSARVCAIKGSGGASGALVVPLLTSAGCGGVFAIELQHGAEQVPDVRAVVTILAAQVSQLLNVRATAAEQPSIRLASA